MNMNFFEKKSNNYREDFPHYSGHIPYKKNEVIGMTVGATNDYIQKILSKEPVKQEVLVPLAYDDYSYYNKDYFNDTFSRDYKLEEEKVFSNKSKDAETWIGSSKYKIYPQHIPGYKAHIPGIYSGNLFGMSYAKSTSVAIKGDYCKGFNSNKDDRYKTCNMMYFNRPKMRSTIETKRMDEEKKEKQITIKKENRNASLEQDLKKIYKSKIANVPTPGYSGHTTVFQKAISYLNLNKILENKEYSEQYDHIMDSRMSESYRTEKIKEKVDKEELPYVGGYKGFRTGVKAGNFHGSNFIDTSKIARTKYLK